MLDRIYAETRSLKEIRHSIKDEDGSLFSQVRFAELIGLSEQAWCQYENGIRKIPLHTYILALSCADAIASERMTVQEWRSRLQIAKRARLIAVEEIEGRKNGDKKDGSSFIIRKVMHNRDTLEARDPLAQSEE